MWVLPAHGTAQVRGTPIGFHVSPRYADRPAHGTPADGNQGLIKATRSLGRPAGDSPQESPSLRIEFHDRGVPRCRAFRGKHRIRHFLGNRPGKALESRTGPASRHCREDSFFECGKEVKVGL